MPTCFVIQPFDSGEFDERFKETFAPAITTGISLALGRLMQKQFLEDAMIEDQNGDYKGKAISSKGWDWIDANEDNFMLRRPSKDNRKLDATGIGEDDIPF